MAFRRTVLLLVLGEGYAEEGESFLRPGTPGDPIPDDELGALHILVARILREKLGLDPIIVWPPRLRSGRRSGNPGLLCDLSGRPRRSVTSDEHAASPSTPPAGRRWFDSCVGRNGVDLAIVVKDSGTIAGLERTLRNLRIAAGPPTRPFAVVLAAASPSLEAWLLPIPEAEGIDESEAKHRWRDAGFSNRPGRDFCRRAREVDLDVVAAACPDGFGRLLSDLGEWARSVASEAPAGPTTS